MFPITTKLAGVTYDDAQDNIRRFGCEDIGTFELVREANNPHDSNAIQNERLIPSDKEDFGEEIGCALYSEYRLRRSNAPVYCIRPISCRMLDVCYPSNLLKSQKFCDRQTRSLQSMPIFRMEIMVSFETWSQRTAIVFREAEITIAAANCKFCSL